MRKTATDTATAIVVIATMFGKNVTEKSRKISLGIRKIGPLESLNILGSICSMKLLCVTPFDCTKLAEFSGMGSSLIKKNKSVLSTTAQPTKSVTDK